MFTILTSNETALIKKIVFCFFKVAYSRTPVTGPCWQSQSSQIYKKVLPLTAQKILGKVLNMKRLLTSNITPNPVGALLESCEKCANRAKNLGLLCLFLHSLKICLCATWMKMTSFVLLQRKYMYSLYLNNTFKLYFQVTYEQINDQWTEWMLMKNRCCTITMIPWIIRSVSQSVHRSVNQSVSQSVSQSMSPWISQSDSQWVRESVSQSVSQSDSQWVCESVSQWVSQWIDQSTCHLSTNQSISQLGNQCICRPGNTSFCHPMQSQT